MALSSDEIRRLARIARLKRRAIDAVFGALAFLLAAWAVSGATVAWIDHFDRQPVRMTPVAEPLTCPPFPGALPFGTEDDAVPL